MTAFVNHNKDFVTSEYRSLLKLLKLNYRLIPYREVYEHAGDFLLWRHDVDFSLNRSLALAKIEKEEGIKSTYFINFHAEFYNVLEKGQTEILHEIQSLGHEIGIHFDCAYYDVKSEDELDQIIEFEQAIFEKLFNCKITVFSFHNPTPLELTFEKPVYGGLVNCYSRWFKDNISYCSDSNGYWRHQRLRDVLENKVDKRLQVLTHPEWWTDEELYPRERVFRSIYGRARANMAFYDKAVDEFKRTNVSGSGNKILSLSQLSPETRGYLDYLWNNKKFKALFIELQSLIPSEKSLKYKSLSEEIIANPNGNFSELEKTCLQLMDFIKQETM